MKIFSRMRLIYFVYLAIALLLVWGIYDINKGDMFITTLKLYIAYVFIVMIISYNIWSRKIKKK